MNASALALSAADFEMQYDKDHRYSFTENENCTIFAYGHRDKAEMAAEVVAYDVYCGAADPDDPLPTTAADVTHAYAVLVNPKDERGEWRLRWGGVTETTPDAFPISLVIR